MSKPQEIPEYLNGSMNQKVLAHINGTSAHSDISEALLDAIKPLGDVQVFCPDFDSFKYVCVSTKEIIFGIAIGMRTIVLKLDARMKSRALTMGQRLYPDCGDDWVAFDNPTSDGDWPSIDYRFWTLKSYVYAREILADKTKK